MRRKGTADTRYIFCERKKRWVELLLFEFSDYVISQLLTFSLTAKSQDIFPTNINVRALKTEKGGGELGFKCSLEYKELFFSRCFLNSQRPSQPLQLVHSY